MLGKSLIKKTIKDVMPEVNFKDSDILAYSHEITPDGKLIIEVSFRNKNGKYTIKKQS